MLKIFRLLLFKFNMLSDKGLVFSSMQKDVYFEDIGKLAAEEKWGN